jgi:hypothetical protein
LRGNEAQSGLAIMSKTYNYSKRSIQSDISEFSFSADWYLANENRRHAVKSGVNRDWIKLQYDDSALRRVTV